MNSNNRMGRIRLPRRMIDFDALNETHDIFAQLKLVPYRAEYMYAEEVIQIDGWSPLFDVVEQGQIAPEYEIMVKTDGKGNFESFSLTRKDS